MAEWEKIKRFQENHSIYARLLGERLATDHSHGSGKVRGILRSEVNYAIGRLERVCKEENMADVLEALSLYFRENPATKALGYTPWGLLGKAKVKKKMVYGGPKEPRN